MRRILLSLLFLLPVIAAGQVAISASGITDSFERPIPLARLCFVPVNGAGVTIGFATGSVQVLPNEVCGTITTGTLQSGLDLAPVLSGNYYHVYVKASNSNTILRDFGYIAITGSTWTLNGYNPPSSSPVGPLEYGTTTTVSPSTPASCSIAGTGPYALSCNVPQGATGATGPSGSGASSGVTEIIPGTNVTCSPLSSGACLGNVTVNASGGGTALPSLIGYTYVPEGGETAVSSATTPAIPVSVGDVVILMARNSTSGTLTSSPSNTFTCLTGVTGGGSAQAEQVCYGAITTAGNTTFTYTPGSSTAYMSLQLVDYAGTLGTLNTSASAGAAGTGTSFTSPAITTTGETLVVFCAATGGESTMQAAGIGGFGSARLASVDQNSLATVLADGGCESQVFTAAQTSITALLGFGAPQTWGGTVLAFNY